MRPGEIDVRALKEKALEFFKKGKFARSAETWSEICKADPKDNQSRLRCGDALTKAGQQAHAYEAYRLAAEGFAKQGFLPQAVAAAKLALTLSPDDEAVKKLLADFHAERFGSRLTSTPGSGAVDAVQAAVLDAAVATAPPDVAAPVLSAPRPVRILARRPSGILNPTEVAAAESAGDAPLPPPPASVFESDAPQRPSRIIAAQPAPPPAEQVPETFDSDPPQRPSRIIASPPAPEAVPPVDATEATTSAPSRPSRIIAAQPASSSAPQVPAAFESDAPRRPARVITAPPAPADPFEARPSRIMAAQPAPPSPLITPPARSRGAASAQMPPAAPLSTPPSAQRPEGEPPPEIQVPLSTPPGPPAEPLEPLSTPPAPQRSRTSAPSSGTALAARAPEAAPRGTPPQGRSAAGDARSTPPPAMPSQAEVAPPLSTPPLRTVSEPAPRSARTVPAAGPTTPARALPRAPKAPSESKPAAQPVADEARQPSTSRSAAASTTPLPAPRRAKSTPPLGAQPAAKVSSTEPEVAATPPPAPRRPSSVGVVAEEAAPTPPPLGAQSAAKVSSTEPEAAATPPPAPRRPSSVGVVAEEAAPTPPPVPPAPQRAAAPTAAPNQGVENVTVPFDAAMIAELRSRISTSDATVVAMSPLPAEVTPAVLPPNDVGDGEHLARVPLFAELTSEAFSTLLQAAPMVRLAAGEVAVEQHALGDSLFAILSGRVRVFRDEPTGRRELAILEAGGVFGEMSLVTGANRSAWVVAEVDDTTLLQVSKLLLVELSSSNPSIARALASLAQRRILANLMATEPIFSGLKRNERLELIERFEVKEVARGQVLVGPSSELGGLFVLTSGELEAVDNRGAVALSPVVLLGDAALLGSEVLTHFMATTRSQVLHLSADHALRLTKHPSVAARRPELLDAALRRLQG